MRILAILLLIICSARESQAQFNDTVDYHVNATASGTINKTNAGTTYIFRNGLQLGVSKKKVEMNVIGSWLYGEDRNRLTNNDFVSTLNMNLYSTLPHFYYWALGNYTTNFSLKINNQYQAGAGVAYNIVDKGDYFLNISEGILYENSDIMLKDTLRDVYNTYRNSLRLSLRLKFANIVTLKAIGFYQNSLLLSSDYIIKTDVSLGLIVKKWITVSTAISYNRFNRTGKENTIFTYGLVLDKYF